MSISSTAISVEWNEPVILNGVIRYYSITYYPTDDSSNTITVNTTDDVTSIMITMLAPFTNYTITVVAVTVAEGDASVPVIVRTDEAGELYYNYTCMFILSESL